MKRPNPRLVDTIPPIMQATARELRRLLQLKATRNPQLQHVLLNDPAAAIAVFRLLGRLRPNAFETVSDAAHAISLVGMEPLRQMVKTLPELAHNPRDRLIRDTAAHAYSQAAHAGHYAAALAKSKGLERNHDIVTAALLQNPAVLALWSDDPEAALQATNAARNGTAFDEAFGAALGEPLDEANKRLAEAWSLPLLARQAMDDWDDLNPRPQLVRLADQLAQTTAVDLRRRTYETVTAVLAEHLACGDDAATTWLHRQTVEAARALYGFGYPLPAFELLFTATADDKVADEAPTSGLVASPADEAEAEQTEPAAKTAGQPNLPEAMADTMRRIRHEARASRVMFAAVNRERSRLRIRLALGGARDDALRQFDVDLGQRHLFSMLMQRPQSVWLNRDNAKKYQAYLPADLRRVFGPEGAYLMSLFIRERPLGLLFADGRGLDAAGYDQFRRLCRAVSDRLADADATED